MALAMQAESAGQVVGSAVQRQQGARRVSREFRRPQKTEGSADSRAAGRQF